MISVVPIGEEVFVQAKLEAKVDDVVSKIQTATSKICDVHIQSFFTALYFGLHVSWAFGCNTAIPENLLNMHEGSMERFSKWHEHGKIASRSDV